MNRVPILFLLISHLLLLSSTIITPAAAAGGRWKLLQRSIGISAMHMQLLHNDRVVIFDRTEFGPSKLILPAGKCANNPNDLAAGDCTAHSAEYDVNTNTVRPLVLQTNVWCSSGSVFPDGRLVQTGGYFTGERKVRSFGACDNCDWQEADGLLAPRWYATNHILPDGRQIIIGGRQQFNYEFYPKTPSSNNLHNLPFLSQTNDPGQENNLYPFVFLNVDGNLFIFANNRAILFDYVKDVVVKTYPQIPGGDPRSYPSSGSAVLLPLKSPVEAEVLVCGGAPKGAVTQAVNGKFVKALNTCGRLKITDASPQWVMETMPQARVMGDMILLPNGNVLIINGASAGTAGWEYGRDPVLSPIIYQPENRIGTRFEVQTQAAIPRMYHSSAILLRDGRILVGGSNPHAFYNFTGVLYPTELSLEIFQPSYLNPEFSNIRPKNIVPIPQNKIGYGQQLGIRFSIGGKLNENTVAVTMVAPPFTTHSFAMNQRLLVLARGKVTPTEKSTYQVQVTTPRSGNLAPAGYYLLFVLHQGIPGTGIWVHIQ